MKIRKGIQLGALLSMVILSSSDMYGQQDPQYTHYMYNTTNINPGYSGTRGVLNVFGMYRTQWVGLDGAPQTANISIDTPLGDNGLSGGINYTNDRIGAMSENNFSVNLA
ncbi:PorP/SprF family type IX secretion system membrane protein, partial [Myroides marinus]